MPGLVDDGQANFAGLRAFEMNTLISRELRFLSFKEEFPAYQVGLRWYKTPNLQWDFVIEGVAVADSMASEGPLCR